MDCQVLHTIARIHNDYNSKFGIPRQSGLVNELRSTIVFEPEYRQAEALRGLEDFTHIWLIWGFSENIRANWSPTVRPPRLGGNMRMGVFATRSSFRPNAIGLSSVRLLEIAAHPSYGHVLQVAGADLMNHTPIYDIKPYIATTDCHPEASKGFTQLNNNYTLPVEIPDTLQERLSSEKMDTLRAILSQDPRPAYHHNEKRIYGFSFAEHEVKFQVIDGKIIVTHID